jgi:microcystin-dependent protein
MSQSDFGVIDPDATSGPTLATELQSFRDALNTSHSGIARPTYVQNGTIWTDTSISPNPVYRYDGSQDVLLGYIDSTNHAWIPPIGGGSGTISAASSTDIGAVKASHVGINGSGATINDFGSTMKPGTVKTVYFTGANTLHKNANLDTHTGADVVTSAGDRAMVVCSAPGASMIMSYVRANTDPAEAAGFVKEFDGLNLPTGYLWCDGSAVSRATFGALFNALTIQVTGTTSNGSAVVNSMSSTVKMRKGMPLSGPGITVGTTIKSVDSGTQITMTANAGVGGAPGVQIIVAPHGIGDGSTTFNVPDRRGCSPIGADDIGGTPALRSQVQTTITTTAGSGASTVGSAVGLAVGWFVLAATVPFGTTVTGIVGNAVALSTGTGVVNGSGVSVTFSPVPDAQAVGSKGGELAHGMGVGEMPSHDHGGATGAHSHTLQAEFTSGTFFQANLSGGASSLAIGVAQGNPTTSDTAPIGAQGGNVAHNNTGKVFVTQYVIKA